MFNTCEQVNELTRRFGESAERFAPPETKHTQIAARGNREAPSRARKISTPRIEIFVTAEDIAQGRRRNTWTSPLCLALRRATGVKWVVEESTAYPITHRNAFIPLPPEAITFISEFDATGAGKPFSFELEVP